ncbi:hypothetical protein M6B38_173965 [Iris pallida]|uniref:Uncharacterized protein n=1 Tax=Iris pallida TaxID=29817 RepID=A0AAX6ERD2_IRIPA|nr:hypothetical protein M6B38_173965 [Iris pallida]
MCSRPRHHLDRAMHEHLPSKPLGNSTRAFRDFTNPTPVINPSTIGVALPSGHDCLANCYTTIVSLQPPLPSPTSIPPPLTSAESHAAITIDLSPPSSPHLPNSYQTHPLSIPVASRTSAVALDASSRQPGSQNIVQLAPPCQVRNRGSLHPVVFPCALSCVRDLRRC